MGRRFGGWRVESQENCGRAQSARHLLSAVVRSSPLILQTLGNGRPGRPVRVCAKLGDEMRL